MERFTLSYPKIALLHSISGVVWLDFLDGNYIIIVTITITIRKEDHV